LTFLEKYVRVGVFLSKEHPGNTETLAQGISPALGNLRRRPYETDEETNTFNGDGISN